MTLTATQRIILGILAVGPISAVELRGILAARRHKLWLASFYQTMSKLETAGEVVGWYVDCEIGGIPVRELYYRLADGGPTP